ncbi:hypothetical protein [Streptomyces sp. XH2]|uniref:hypothetical protein n=1 Tax=Streptomyces sp. XH2 TaxID=3412483 RepID=UPI003C7AAF3D
MKGVQGDEQARTRPPYPEPVDIERKAQWTKSAFDRHGVRQLVTTIPAVLTQVFRMAWRIDRRDVLAMVGAQVVYGIGSAVALAATARAMVPVLGSGSASHRCTRHCRRWS